MNRQIQCLVSHKTFQSSVFLRQLLETPSLIHLHTTVLLAPPVVGLFCDADLPDRWRDRLAVGYRDFYLSQLVQDLFWRMPSSRRVFPLQETSSL